MPVRNLIALSTALLVAFIFGLIQAMEWLTRSSALRLGAAGLAIAVAVGLVVAIGVRARLTQRVVPALLRAGLSGALFVFMYEGMRLFTRFAHVGLAAASFVGAALVALLLARLHPSAADRAG